MVSAAEIATAHQLAVIARTETSTRRAVRLWQQMDVSDLDGSWMRLGPLMAAQATNAQLANAKDSQRYASVTARHYSQAVSADRVEVQSFAGIDGSGRDAESLLHGAVTTTKERIGMGATLPDSMLTGATYLAAMMKTAIADIGRSSDMVSATSHGFTHYVRVVSSHACSRCAILAGKSSFKTAFKRHPACKCTAFPVEGDGSQILPANLHSDPEQYFDSLSAAEQDRIFTKGGAEAIRSGAGVQEVVAARRGAQGISYSRAIGDKVGRGAWRRMERTTIGFRPDGSPIQVFTTTEGTTARGQFGRIQSRIGVGSQRVAGSRYSSSKRIRLMPESIVDLTDDVNLRRTLLRDAGYLDFPAPTYAKNLHHMDDLRKADRAIADKFYRHLGVTLG